MSDRLRALVVDDEPLSRRAMVQLLEARTDVHVVAACLDAHDAERYVSEVDVVFLDVQMPGPSGLAFARTMPRAGPPCVVFVTAYDEYAVPAFETEAVDFLPKPVAPARLDQALRRVREQLSLASGAPPGSLWRLVTRVGANEVIIAVGEIAWIEADGVYAGVQARGRRWLVRQSLDALEATLPPGQFLRAHRSWLVPTAGVECVQRSSSDQRALLLRDGTVVPVSRRRVATVLRALRGRSARPVEP